MTDNKIQYTIIPAPDNTYCLSWLNKSLDDDEMVIDRVWAIQCTTDCDGNTYVSPLYGNLADEVSNDWGGESLIIAVGSLEECNRFMLEERWKIQQGKSSKRERYDKRR